MSKALSIFVAKSPSSAEISLFRATEKVAKKLVLTQDRHCCAFIETIADLDEAHFLSKFEMADLVTKLTGLKPVFPPRDRLVAAKALALALLNKQDSLPEATIQTKTENEQPTRCFAPGPIISSCKKGTKLAVLVELLQKGTTLPEMMQATGWRLDSVMTGLNYDLHKRKGIGYRITGKGPNEVYTIVLPVDYKGNVIV